MKEYHKRWYQENKERLKEKFRMNHKKNIEKDRKRSKDWYMSHKDVSLDKSMKAYRRNPDAKRDYNFKATYNISLDDYNKMVSNQGGKCAICGEHQSSMKMRLSVDHDHKTGKIRKLLCHRCNLALGLFKENIELFENAVQYLEEFND